MPALVEEALTSETFRGNFAAHRVTPGSRKGVSISVSMPLHGLSSTAPSAEPTQTPDALILASVLGYGAATSAGYDAVNLAGGDVDGVDWTDATGLIPGQALLVPVSGGHSVGWIQTITQDTPDVLELISPLSAAPSGSGQVYGSYVCGLSTAQAAPLTLLWLGKAGQIRLYDGAVSEATITREGNGRVMLSATIQFGGWIIDSGASDGPGQYPFALPDLPAAIGRNGARVVLDGTASTALGSFEVSISNTLAEAPSIGSQEGLGAYVTTDRAVTITLTGHQPDLSDLASPGASLGTIQIDCGNTPGKAFSILVPSAQVQEMEAISDMDGVIGHTLTLAPAGYTGDGSSTEPGNTVFRVAFM